MQAEHQIRRGGGGVGGGGVSYSASVRTRRPIAARGGPQSFLPSKKTAKKTKTRPSGKSVELALAWASYFRGFHSPNFGTFRVWRQAAFALGRAGVEPTFHRRPSKESKMAAVEGFGQYLRRNLIRNSHSPVTARQSRFGRFSQTLAQLIPWRNSVVVTLAPLANKGQSRGGGGTGGGAGFGLPHQKPASCSASFPLAFRAHHRSERQLTTIPRTAYEPKRRQLTGGFPGRWRQMGAEPQPQISPICRFTAGAAASSVLSLLRLRVPPKLDGPRRTP